VGIAFPNYCATHDFHTYVRKRITGYL